MDSARLECRSRDLAQLDQLLIVMEEQASHTDRNNSGYDSDVYLACADVKRSKSDSVCEKRPDADLAAKRATLERLIRARCDSLAEHLCGSVSNFFGQEQRVEKSPPPPPPQPPIVAEDLSRVSWNERLSLVDRDLNVVRRLICPEREAHRDDDDDEDAAAVTSRVAAPRGVTAARDMLGDIHRLIAPGGEAEGERRGGERRSAPTREQRQRGARRLQPPRSVRVDHGERVDASSRGSLNAPARSEGRGPPVTSERGAPARPERAATFAGPKTTTFTKLPEESRAAAYEAEEGGGKNTKPDRVDPREVLRRQYCPQGGGTNAAPRRQSRPSNNPVVSKHPQLATIVEEREASRSTSSSTTTTTPAPSRTLVPANNAAAHRTTHPMTVAAPQRVAVARARFEAEANSHAANQRKATVPTRAPPTPQDTRVGSGEGRDASVTTDRVRETACRLGELRGAPEAPRHTPSRREEDVAREKVEPPPPPPSEPETSPPRKAIFRDETVCSNTRAAAEDEESEGSGSLADEGVEQETATPSDVEEVKACDRKHILTEGDRSSSSTPDVARLQRSWLTRARHEGGGNNEGSPGDVTPIHNSAGGGGGLKFLASVEDKLSCNQELVVLLWMCDLSERLERRSREATNRMRKAVSVGDATLTKLRLLKESLLKVSVPGDSRE